jgi:hypothetical protein
MNNTIYNYDNRRLARLSHIVTLEKLGKVWFASSGNQVIAQSSGSKSHIIELCIEWAKTKEVAITFDRELWKTLQGICQESVNFKTA